MTHFVMVYEDLLAISHIPRHLSSHFFSKDVAKYPNLPRHFCIGFLNWNDQIGLVVFGKVKE